MSLLTHVSHRTSQGCYQKTHKLYVDKSPFRRSLVGGDSQAQLTEEQRRDRQRSIQLHMQLLQHASGCQNQQCPSANCNKMKVCALIYVFLAVPHAESVETRCYMRNTCPGRLRYLSSHLGIVANSRAPMSPRHMHGTQVQATQGAAPSSSAATGPDGRATQGCDECSV